MKLSVVVMLVALAGCGAHPPVLRQSVCFVAERGVQVCQFSYEHDKEKAQ